MYLQLQDKFVVAFCFTPWKGQAGQDRLSAREASNIEWEERDRMLQALMNRESPVWCPSIDSRVIDVMTCSCKEQYAAYLL